MKMIYRILNLLIFASLFLACRDEDEVRMPKIMSAASARVLVDQSNSYLNFADLSASKFVFDVYTVNKDLDRIEFRANYYFVAQDSTSDTLVISSITNSDFKDGVYKVELTAEQFATTFNIPSGIQGMVGGDVVNFTTFAILKDGREFSYKNAGPSIAGNPNVTPGGGSSFTTVFSTFVGCPSDIGGDYSSLTTGTSTDPAPSPNPTIDFASEITLTQTSPTSYSISDAFGGLYLEWYGVYGIEGPLTGATVTDICGTISVGPLSDPFGGTVTGSGSIAADGTITINWENNFGDEAVTVYTKK